MTLPVYATESDYKAFSRIPADDEVDDAEINLALSAASREIDQFCNRIFATTLTNAEARYYTARWDQRRYRYVVDVDDFATTTGLAVAVDLDQTNSYATSVVAADCRPWPLNAAALEKPWTALELPYGTAASCREGAVEVTAKWGWTAVPDAVKQACLLQTNRVFSRRESPYGISGSPDMQGEMRLLAKLDPDVEKLLKTVRRVWGAVS